VFGFEYWTLGRTAAAARQLGWFIDEVRAATGAAEVDVIGHSMGGMVGRYYVALAGGDGVVRNLVTIGAPHTGTEVSALGLGHPMHELVLGSPLRRRRCGPGSPRSGRAAMRWCPGRGSSRCPAPRS